MNKINTYIDFKNVWSIAKKEIKSFLDNPASYIVLIVFGILWEFIYFRNIFLINEVSLRSLYDFFPWLMLLLVPAITMGSIAKEKDEGTLEWLLTHPIRSLELTVGKFLGSLIYVSFALLFSLPLALIVSKYGNLDWGMYFGQLLGSIFFAASLVSLGLFISSFLKNQIAALLLTSGVGFIFVIMGSEFFTISLPLYLVPVFERLSLIVHFSSMARGVIDLRDIWYFLSFILVFLSLTYLQLLYIKFGNRKKIYAQFQIGVFLFIGISILTNILGNRIQGRLDITQDRVYTLSKSTKNTLANLDDLVTITLYVSRELPTQYQAILRDIKDIVADYKNSSGGALVVKTIDPSSEESLAQEALSLGIKQIQFNVIGQEEFQVKQGYLGIKISYLNSNEILPAVVDTSDLEYQLTSIIRKLTDKNKKNIGFVTGYGERSLDSDYSILNSELGSQFNISSYNLEEDIKEIDPTLDVVVLANPSKPYSDEHISAIKDFLKSNKSLLVLADSFGVNEQYLLASAVNNNITNIVTDYGLILNRNIAYDLQSNQTIRFGNGSMTYLLPYPYWLLAQTNQESSVTANIYNILLPWAGTIDVASSMLESKGYTFSPLLTTTPLAGVSIEESVELGGMEGISLLPDQDFSKSEKSKKVLAVSVDTNNTEGKLIVVADSDFLTDTHVQNSPQNISFALNALSWLSNTESLADIKIKTLGNNSFVFEHESDPVKIKYLNLGLVILLPLTVGISRIIKRRKLRYATYETLA